MQLTYQVDGEPLEQLPNGYSDHYVPDGFERDYEQGYDNEISFLHAYVDANDKNIFYYVDCSIIQDYGQVETFDNEHTVYERIKVGTADATLGTSNNGGHTGYVLVWEKDGISHTIIGKIPRKEILKIAESISWRANSCPHTCNCLQMCGRFFIETSKVDKTLNFFQKSCHKHNVNYVD